MAFQRSLVNCQVCGKRFQNTEINEHELNCAEESQEKMEAKNVKSKQSKENTNERKRNDDDVKQQSPVNVKTHKVTKTKTHEVTKTTDVRKEQDDDHLNQKSRSSHPVKIKVKDVNGKNLDNKSNKQAAAGKSSDEKRASPENPKKPSAQTGNKTQTKNKDETTESVDNLQGNDRPVALDAKQNKYKPTSSPKSVPPRDDKQKEKMISTPYPAGHEEKNEGPSADVTKVSSGEYSDILPDLNRQAEAAYESHKQNLVPCDHCGRRFTADRVMVHQDACIENPGKMTRKTVTPDRDALK